MIFFIELSLPFHGCVSILGVRNLNDLRAKDLAKDEDGNEEDIINLTPVEEIAEAVKEVETVEAIMKEVELVYKDSLYIRIGCLCHKVRF